MKRTRRKFESDAGWRSSGERRMETYADPSLVDITHDLETLGLLLEYDSAAGFVVCHVQDDSPAAECGRVQRGAVVVEYNSVPVQPLQRAPSVKKHGVRSGKFTFLRILKDGQFIECAIERCVDASGASRSLQMHKHAIEKKASGFPAADFIGSRTTNLSKSVPPHGPEIRNNGVKKQASLTEASSSWTSMSLHESFRASDTTRSLSVDHQSRPPSAVEGRIDKTSTPIRSINSSKGRGGLGTLRWKTYGETSPAPVARAPTPNSDTEGLKTTKKSNRNSSSEYGAALSEALARIEVLSKENELLRAKIDENQTEALLEEQKEAMEKNLRKVLAQAADREAAYERQLASHKEELSAVHRRMQEMMGENAELQFMSTSQSLNPSVAMSRCLEAMSLKILAIKPDFSGIICRDVYTMMYSWCFENWISPTLAKNIAGGTRLLVRDESVKNGLLDCGAMEAMVKITAMFGKDNNEIESMAVEHAAASLANFALKHPRSRAALVQCGGMLVLVKVLSGSTSPSLLEKACAAVSHTLCSVDTKGAFVESGGIQALVKLVTRTHSSTSGFGYERLLEEAARAFRNLAHGDDVICRQICAAGGIDALATLCQSSMDTGVVTQASAALANLACDEACRSDLRKRYDWAKDFGAKRLAALAEERRQNSRTSTPVSSRGKSPSSSSFSSSAIQHSPASSRGASTRPQSVTCKATRAFSSASPSSANGRPHSATFSRRMESDADSDSAYFPVAKSAKTRSESCSPGRMGRSQVTKGRSRTPDPFKAPPSVRGFEGRARGGTAVGR